MIRLADKKDNDHLLSVIRKAPCLGVSMEVDWRLMLRNAEMPYRIYLVGERAVLSYSGYGATLIGMPDDPDELLYFLDSQRVKSIESDLWLPSGWQRGEYMCMYLARRPGPRPLPAGYDNNPRATEVMEVLESTEKITPADARDRLYFNLCVRRNHGFADIVGVRVYGELMSTAGVYAITEYEAYISCVETRPEARGRGYAGGLVLDLAARYGNRRVTLLCEKEMVLYYERLGFRLAASGGIMVADRRKRDVWRRIFLQ